MEDDAVLIHSDGTIVTCDDKSARLSKNTKLAREDFESSVVLLHYSQMNDENLFNFLSKCEQSTLLRQHKDYPITAADIACLKVKKWLNDKVVNGYLKLLVDNTGMSAVFLDSYFYQRLIGKKNVDRYFKSKTNQKDIVLVPICSRGHWSLNVAVVSERMLKVYDSTRIHDKESRHIQQYLAKHSGSEWNIQIMKNLPEQLSGTDCGVHALQIARSYLYKEPYNMDEADVENIRTRILIELMTGKLEVTDSGS